MDHNMGGGDHHDSGLALSLGRGGPPTTTTHNRHHHHHHRSREVPFEPSLTLSISDEAASSFSTGCPSSTNINNNKNNIVKRERDVYLAMSEEGEVERANSSTRTSDDDEDGSNARKKLRLTKEQSALLEDRFKEHSTLNPKQKQALAKQLNLRPRQVEVWFQNRRARTKLKQTEVDCEFLKRCCETLTDENRRLHKELSELRALKFAPPPLYMQLPAATLTMCPSCERVGGSVGDGSTKGGSTTSGHGSTFVVAAAANKQPAHFFNPFTHSAAC